jgi:hypothetical protein
MIEVLTTYKSDSISVKSIEPVDFKAELNKEIIKSEKMEIFAALSVLRPKQPSIDPQLDHLI